jgi:hypothetical protein
MYGAITSIASTGFALPYKIRFGEIEIDALIICPNIMDGAYKGNWSFLSGLERKFWPLRRQ